MILIFSYPLQVDIDITEKCNFKCKYCTASDRKDFSDELSIIEFHDLIYDLYNWGVTDFNIAGGEPLLKDGILELLKNIVALKGVNLTLVTNGSLINEKVLSFLNDNPNLNFVISLDSVYKSINEISRDKTEIVLNNIKLCIKNNINFTVAQVITKFNIETFFDNAKLLQDIGVERLLIIKYIASGGEVNSKDECEIPYDEWCDFLNELTSKKVNGEFKKYGISVACPWELYLPLFSSGYNPDDIYRIWNYKSPLLFDRYRQNHETGCHAGITSLNILANGDVYPCSIAGYNKKLLCGNIKEQSIMEIWNTSPVLTYMRNISVNDIGSECKECDIVEKCGGGCRIRAFYGSGKLTGKDYICPNLYTK